MFDPNKIWNSKQLPTLPAVAIRLLDLSKDQESELRDFVEVVRTDPAISAKILKSANSSFFGLSSKVTSVERAVPLLGSTVVTSLALSFSLTESAMNSGPLTEYFTNYWRQSVVNATAAECMSAHIPDSLACEYFLAGLLMDIGRLALLKTLPNETKEVLDQAAEKELELVEVERSSWGTDHPGIGAELMERWKLPERLINPCRLHHMPLEELRAKADTEELSLTVTLAFSAAVGDYFCSNAKGQALERMKTIGSEFFQFSDSDLNNVIDQMVVRMNAAAELFSVNLDDLGDPSDLMAEANQQLATLAMREHVASTQAAVIQERVEKEKQELEFHNAELRQKTLHDGLTSIYNRSFFDESLLKEVQRCCRHGSQFGVIFLDIDKFKVLNDTYGHAFGDVVLKQVAQALNQTIRSSDTLARYGGEEFVILVSHPTEKGIQKFAERLRVRVESEEILLDGKRIPVTVSVGAAVTLPGRNDLDAGKKLLAEADAAMYESKRNGRNQVHYRSMLDDDTRRILNEVIQNRFSRWLVNQKIFDIPTIARPLQKIRPQDVRIGELASQVGFLDSDQVREVLGEQDRTSLRFGEAAMALHLLTERQVIALLVIQQEDPHVLASLLVSGKLLTPERSDELLLRYLSSLGLPTKVSHA